MSYVEHGKWSCPACPPGRGTVVVVGSDADVAACIHAAQLRHGRAHAKAHRTLGALGLDDQRQPTVHEAVPDLVIAPTGRTT